MTRTSVLRTWLVASFALLASCGTDPETGPSPPDTTRPVVNHVSMPDGEEDAGLVDRIVVTFSEKMDASSITPSTMFVSGRAPKGHIGYDEASRTAAFTPDTLYAAETWHVFVVGDSVADLAGNPLVPDTTAFRTGAFDCEHLADHMEPNNSIAAAAPIELERTYRTLTGCGSDTDFYRFTLDHTAKVIPLASYRHAVSELCHLFIRRADGGHYSHSYSCVDSGDSLLGRSFTLMPGTYLLEAVSQDGYDDYVVYDIRLNTADPCSDDAYEDNDFFDEAVHMAPGTYEDLRGCRLDGDYYAVEADAGETITVTVAADTSGIVMKRVGIYGPSEDELVSYWDSFHNPVTVDAAASESGTHYILVRFWSDGIVYDMNINLTN
ncbi:MAG: Ig-like domain-containing protein [Candidatus Eisenbacteria sp.]|nr:Ig-like domain-containing protein [Candidatus Eisenbacteria bacterium]